MEKYLVKGPGTPKEPGQSPATPKTPAQSPSTPKGSGQQIGTPENLGQSSGTPNGPGLCSGMDPFHTPSVKSSNRANIPPTPTIKQSKTRIKLRDSTPKSHNSRTAWTPIFIKLGGRIQVHILCQRSNGFLGPYTSAGSASKRRPLWNSIRSCEYVVEKVDEVSKRFFVFTNIDRESAKFRADLLDPILVRTNSFSQKCAALLVSNPRLLAAYLSLISVSVKFCNFAEEAHMRNGIRKDGEGLTEASLVGIGGTLEEYESFVKLAVENTEDVGCQQVAGLKISPASKKRKVSDYFNKVENKKKMSRTEEVEDRYKQMLAEDGGLEKTVASGYVNFQSIPLDKLAISPDLFLPINQNKVNEIAESIDDRLEPSQLVVSVVPADLARFERDGTDDKYWVVHGVHRLEAMKKVADLNEAKDQKVLCFILKVNAPSLANYVNIKCNDLASNFQSRASNEALFFVYRGLLQRSQDPHESQEVIEKICFSRHLRTEDLTVYRKVFAWPLPVLDQLLAVLDKYQSYQTKDVTARGVKSKIKRREPNTISNAMFKKLGNCSPDFFKVNHFKIISNEISLKQLLDESDESNKRAKSEKNMVFCAGGMENIETLNKKYPDKFGPEIVKQFVGAELSGKKRNVQGLRLTNYVKSVKQGVSFTDTVKFESFDSWSEVSVDKLQESDVSVLHVCEDNMELMKCWIDILCASVKDFYSLLLVLDSEKLLHDVYTCLNTWKDNRDFQVRLVMFRKEKSSVNNDGINENVVFAVLCGKVSIFGEQILSVNDQISQELIKVISQVTPPAGKVAYVSRGRGQVVQIHRESGQNSDVQVTYFVTKKELGKVKEKFLVQAPDPEQIAKLNDTTAAPIDSNVDDDDGSDLGQTDGSDDESEESIDVDAPSDTCSIAAHLSRQSSTSTTKYI